MMEEDMMFEISIHALLAESDLFVCYMIHQV